MEYLIPIDGIGLANPSAAADGFIGIEHITKMLNKTREKIEVPIILIFDCCRVGIGRNDRFVGDMSEPQAPAFGNHEIANMYIVYSTVRNHVPLRDGSGSKNGAFTEYFLKHLDKTMDVEELARGIRVNLLNDDRFW